MGNAYVIPRPKGYDAVLMDWVKWVVIFDGSIYGGYRTETAAQKYADELNNETAQG